MKVAISQCSSKWAAIYPRSINRNLFRLRPLYLCKILLRNHRCLCIYAAIIIVQCISSVRIALNYKELYSIANSPFPDTFWHVYYSKQRTSIPRTSSVSLVNESVLVLACARDVAKVVPTFRRNLYSILKLFKDYHVLLGESDSKDDTLMSLRHWKDADSKVHVYTYGRLSVTYSKVRAHRIAFCRNNLLETARGSIWIDKAKYLLVMDIGINANSILTVDNFLTNFQYDTRDWAVMTATQTKVYYDIWSVRCSTLNFHCLRALKRNKYQQIVQKICLHVHMKPIPRDFGLIPVRSAFGGFAIYQTIYLNNCTYEVSNKNNMEKSEHISFHNCVIKNGGKIFINPKFQNGDGLKN